MSTESVRGVCGDCGKTYRVPSADRSYDCKACGGEVTAASSAASAASSESPRRSARRRERPEPKGSSNGKWIVLVVVLLLSGGGFAAYSGGLLGGVVGAGNDERLEDLDLDVVNAGFADAWNAGDTRSLANAHHPTGRPEFELRLKSIVRHREWGDSWPPITQVITRIEEGTMEQPVKGSSLAAIGEDSLRLGWQYSQNSERWFIFDCWITPTGLRERAEAFQAAWAESTSQALRPFFREATRAKMQELLDSLVSKAGWNTAYPALGDLKIVDEHLAMDRATSFLSGGSVDTIFQSAEGALLVRWKFYQAEDEWIVTGFKMP